MGAIILAIIGLVTALVPVLFSLRKSPQDKVKDQQKEINDADQKFRQSGDTTDLGRIE